MAGAEDQKQRNRRDPGLKLWVVLSRAFHAVERHAHADFRRHGLTAGEFGVLEALYHRGPLLLHEIKSKILVSSGGVTYLVDRLADRGLVERRPCPEDRRASYAALTEAGEELIGEVFPEHAEVIRHAVSGLEPDERREATALLKKLGHRAAEMRTEAGP